MSAVAADASLRPEWEEAPKVGGKPVDVSYRIGVERVAEVNTVASSAFIRVAVTYYWTDPRLVGWEGPLPDSLWGPTLVLRNDTDSLNVFDEVFALIDDKGRIKRGTVYQGTMSNPMDLLGFPFDADAIELEFQCTSHWKSKDGKLENMDVIGRSLSLRPVTDANEGANPRDPFCRLESKRVEYVYEWDLLGYSHQLEVCNQVTGVQSDEIKFSIHISRKTGFYWYRVILPLFSIALSSICVYGIPPDDLPDRITYASAMVIASIAMQYVVTELLPKVDDLTLIDKVVLSNLVLNLVSLSETSALNTREWFAKWEWLVVSIQFAIYTIFNLGNLYRGISYQKNYATKNKVIRFVIGSSAEPSEEVIADKAPPSSEGSELTQRIKDSKDQS